MRGRIHWPLRLEPRPEPSGLWLWAAPVLAIVLTALLAGALFVALGKDPLKALAVFFFEPLNGPRAISEVLLKATPLIAMGLGLALCFRANVWNIGAEGQFLAGAMAGGGTALLLSLQAQAGAPWPQALAVPVVLAAGVLGGAAWAGLVALLRDRFNANEILVSLMLVYVAQQLLNWLVFGPWKDPQGFNFPQTVSFHASTHMPALVPPFRLHWGLVLALLLAVAMGLFLFRSLRGFALIVGGQAPLAARFAGFSSRAALWQALLISGGLAGLAGAMEAAGPLKQLTPHVSTGLGFTAIIVAFVGRLHPLAIVLASLLLSMLVIGGELAQSRLGLPHAITGMFQGLLLVLVLACDSFINQRVRFAAPGPKAAAAPLAGPAASASPATPASPASPTLPTSKAGT